MKSITLVLSLIVIVTLFNSCKKNDAQPQTPTTILTNGDMEQPPYQDWESYLGATSTVNANKYTVDYSTEASSSPTHSIKVTCSTAPNDTTYQYMQQVIYTSAVPIPAGAKLTMKAKIKTVNVQGKGIVLGMGGNKGASDKYAASFYTSTEGKTTITGTNDFKEYTLTFDSFPGNTYSVFVLLFFSPTTTGTAYYDDVSLTVN